MSDATLPGLGTPDHLEGEVERSARTTLAAMAGQLDARHAVICQTMLTVARQLDRAANSRNAKDYGVANLVAQLRETYLVLVPDKPEGGEGDAFDRLARELGRAAVVRNSPQPITPE